MRKLTDLQLSRVLSAHAAGLLARYGRRWGSRRDNGLGCLNQFAYNIVGCGLARNRNRRLADAFDRDYDSFWTTRQFHRWLIRVGAA